MPGTTEKAQENERKKDIFDKLMELPLLRVFGPFFDKHREGLLYLFFGGLAFFLNMLLFFLFHTLFGMQEGLATAIGWVLCVLFQYFTNKVWVFQSRAGNTAGLVKEMASFFGGRIFTLVVEEAIIAVFITWLGDSIYNALRPYSPLKEILIAGPDGEGIPATVPVFTRGAWDLIVKLFAQFVIIVLNYVISKLFVFNKKEEAA